MKENKVALVVVDPQIDFFPGGALGAPKAGQIIKPVNTLLNKGRKNSWGIFISRELHDLQTKEHFNVHGTHCVIGSPGAEIHPEINTQGAVFINKGTGPDDHYYSSLKGKDENSVGQANTFTNIGIVFSRQGQYDKAKDYYFNALNIYKILDDSYGKSLNFGNIGTTYKMLKNYIFFP